MDLGQKIASLRIDKGLFQKDLAQEIGVSTGKIAEWESNEVEPSVSEISKLCTFFGVSSDYLIMDAEKVAEHIETTVNGTMNKKGKSIIIGML